MGEVWRGTDTRLNRQVAVKILHASLSTTKAFRERFGAEARAAAALRAPGIVDLYDYGEDHPDDNTVISYLVMEFVPGRALSVMLAERGRLPAGDTMAIIGRCAQALDAAHQAGVIHRDVKPGNILVLDDGNIKVVDFGIARAHGESGLTATGQVMGTVAYVSPEQLYDEELGGASDIYSLGVVAYECLAGRKPFTGDVPAAVIHAQLHQEPPPLPEDVPAPVAELVMKCLAKSPADRWESGAALAERCRHLAAGLPQGDSTEPMDSVTDTATGAIVRVPAPGDTQSQPVVTDVEAAPASEAATGRPDRRRRSQLVAVLVAVAILAAVGTAAAWRPWETPAVTEPGDDRDRTTVQTREPEDDAEESSVDDGGWEDGGQWESPSGSESPSPDGSPSSPEPSEDETSTEEPTDTTSPSEPEPSTSDDGGDDGGDDPGNPPGGQGLDLA